MQAERAHEEKIRARLSALVASKRASAVGLIHGTKVWKRKLRCDGRAFSKESSGERQRVTCPPLVGVGSRAYEVFTRQDGRFCGAFSLVSNG